MSSRVALAGIFVLTGLIVAVPMTAVRSHVFAQMGASDRQAIINAEIDKTSAPPRNVFLVSSPSSLLALSLAATWNVTHDDRDTFFFPLQFARRPLLWTRDDDTTMTLTSRGRPFLDHAYEALFRSGRHSISVGTTFETPEFTATAAAVDADGLHAVRFEFRASLDSRTYQFLVWREGRLARIDPPPVGQSIDIPEPVPAEIFTP